MQIIQCFLIGLRPRFVIIFFLFCNELFDWYCVFCAKLFDWLSVCRSGGGGGDGSAKENNQNEPNIDTMNSHHHLQQPQHKSFHQNNRSWNPPRNCGDGNGGSYPTRMSPVGMGGPPPHYPPHHGGAFHHMAAPPHPSFNPMYMAAAAGGHPGAGHMLAPPPGGGHHPMMPQTHPPHHPHPHMGPVTILQRNSPAPPPGGQAKRNTWIVVIL